MANVEPPKNITVENTDFEVSINRHPEAWLYLDPPYTKDLKLYGSKGKLQTNFDHARLYQVLKKRKSWLLSYNDSDYISNLHRGHKIEMVS